MQRIEIGDAVDAEHHCLAIDDELLDPVLERRFHDPRIAIGPVISVARKQAHAIALPLHPDAIAVVFDFVKPLGAPRNLGSPGRDAKLKRL
jgi:hypothetical protein